LAETDPAGRAWCFGRGEGLKADAFRIDGSQADTNLGAVAVKDGGGIAGTKAQDVDGVVGLLRGKVTEGEGGLVKAVAGHRSALEQFAGFFEEGVPLRMGELITEAGKVFQGLFLGGVEVFGNFHADPNMEVPLTSPGKGGNALATEPEHFVGGGAGGDFEIQLPIKARDADLRTQGELGE